MMDVVLTRLKDFSCRTPSFSEAAEPRESRTGGCRLDLESSLAWLRRELVELRSLDQVLIRQLMELNSGIQELKLELSEEDEEDEEGSCWDSEDSICSGSRSGSGSGSGCGSGSGQVSFTCRLQASRKFCRRSSVP